MNRKTKLASVGVGGAIFGALVVLGCVSMCKPPTQQSETLDTITLTEINAGREQTLLIVSAAREGQPPQQIRPPGGPESGPVRIDVVWSSGRESTFFAKPIHPPVTGLIPNDPTDRKPVEVVRVMPQPVPPVFAPAPPKPEPKPPADPVAKLVEFIRQKDKEAAEQEEKLKEIRKAFRDYGYQMYQKWGIPDMNTLQNPAYRADLVYSQKLQDNERSAILEAGRILSDRGKAVRELTAKVGIVRVRELGIRD